jgi:HEAT repeat protein
MRRAVLTSLVFLLGGCGRPSTDDWLKQLKEGDVVKKRQAIRELGGRTTEAERVVPPLVEVLQDESPYVRRDAAAVLGKFGPEEAAVAALLAARKDKDQGVRKAVEAALKKIDPVAAARAGIR